MRPAIMRVRPSVKPSAPVCVRIRRVNPIFRPVKVNRGKPPRAGVRGRTCVRPRRRDKVVPAGTRCCGHRVPRSFRESLVRTSVHTRIATPSSHRTLNARRRTRVHCSGSSSQHPSTCSRCLCTTPVFTTTASNAALVSIRVHLVRFGHPRETVYHPPSGLWNVYSRTIFS